MTLRIIIPMRPFAEAKSRLGTVLTPPARAALAEAMLRHVLSVAESVAPTYVISRDPAVRALARRPIREHGYGLNPALEQAARALDGTAPILALSADLPLLAPDDLHAMIAHLAHANVIAATDRAGTGTNALLLARPKLIPYSFGNNSRHKHQAAAQSRSIAFTTHKQIGTATDIDWPRDMGEACGMLTPQLVLPKLGLGQMGNIRTQA